MAVQLFKRNKKDRRMFPPADSIILYLVMYLLGVIQIVAGRKE